MKNTYLLLSLFCILACQNPQSSSQNSTTSNTTESLTYDKIDVDEFAQKLASISNAQLVDVRTPEEFQQGHIEGANNIDFRQSDFEKNIAQLNKDQAVLVYCKSGGRSGRSMKAFKNLGFVEVYDLNGGYNAWSAKNQ